MDELVEKYIEHASHITAKRIRDNISMLKEPILRNILAGKSISEKEEVYLQALEDVEAVVQGCIDNMEEI